MADEEGRKALDEIFPAFTICNLQPFPSEYEETAKQRGNSLLPVLSRKYSHLHLDH